MERFLSVWYYLAPLPDPNFQFTKFTLGLGIALLLLGFLSAYYIKKRLKDPIARKILKNYPGKLKIYGLLVLLLLIFREQGIPYLAMRLWWFVLLAFFLSSALKLAFTYRKQYAEREARVKQNERKEKYLPRKKH